MRQPKSIAILGLAAAILATAAFAQTQRSGGGEVQKFMQQYQQVAAEKTALQAQLAQMKKEPRAILLHLARPDDSGLVGRLTDLDDAAPLEGEILIAFVEGEAVAALSLEVGRVVANPFRATTDAVSLLRLRQQHLSHERGRRSWRTILRPRIAV